MEAKLEQLTTAEQEWIVQQIAAAQEFVRRIVGKDTTELPSPEDLDNAFDCWLQSHDPADANSVVNCVGIAFGQHLVNSTSLEWVIATDDYGTELAIYGSRGDILLFPQNFVAKRYEANIGLFIVESIQQIRADVSDIQSQNNSDAV